MRPVDSLRTARAVQPIATAAAAAARGQADPGFLLLPGRWFSRLQAPALQLLPAVPASASLAGCSRRLRHGPHVPLAFSGPRHPRRRNPERRVFGEVAEQEPLPRHAERERLGRTPLGHGPSVGGARTAARGGGRRGAAGWRGPRAAKTLGSRGAAPEIRTCAVMRAHSQRSGAAAGWWELAAPFPERLCDRKCTPEAAGPLERVGGFCCYILATFFLPAVFRVPAAASDGALFLLRSEHSEAKVIA